VAWQHIHLLGHYTFRGNGHAIDLEALLANVKLGDVPLDVADLSWALLP